MGNNNYSYRSTENENDYYTGTYIGGRKHGKGILKTKKGVYEGEFKNDKREGVGEFKFYSGDVYTGQFINNEITGDGKC